MDYVITWHGLTLYVVIIILILIDSFRAENVQIYRTKAKYTWFQVKNECSLIRNESTNMSISTLDTDLMWTGDSARYLPWVEYLGCFRLKDMTLVDNSTNVETGKQLKECLLHCKQYDFIGLQQSKCVCLFYLELTADYIEHPCNTNPEKCDGDLHAFCGEESSTNSYSIYQTVNLTERVEDGDCLAVDKNNDSFNYISQNCSAPAYQICLRDSVYSTNFLSQHKSTETWIGSFSLCPSYMLARYRLVFNIIKSLKRGTYWLSNTRRWIQGTFTDPEFCVASRFKQDGCLQRFPIRCDKQLPGLCVGRQEMHDREKNGNKMTSTDDTAPIDKFLLISVIAATSLTILVTIVIVILCIRMKRLQSNSSENQIVVDGKNVVYAQVDRSMNQDRTIDEARGHKTVEDTYDHMDRRCLNQRPPKEESNYDMMSNIATVEENDYSHTNETERERQCFIDASSEYSHVTIVGKSETRD
ncbi:uncharacterized protein LOC127706781 [Mytilus californianus]|uniref:uncharacterized protein LOC127706781 n=1 Tax=Mytilus californianus TaxID=6549 RepID=UPI0022468564|nr:uncharacterized protein LOC127706781 [Mytilus californianus]